MLANEIKTASNLRMFVESNGQSPYFFTRKTMKFFGDTMKNYGVRKVVGVRLSGGEPIKLFELYRKRPVKNGPFSSAYFCADKFERVFIKEDSLQVGWE